MPNKIKVYLAGGTVTDWREAVAKAFGPRFECLDPMTQSRQQAIMEFTTDDLALIDGCDILFGVNDYESQHGMALEFGYAFARLKPIIYVARLPRVESMMAAVSKAVFTDTDAAVEYIKKRF